MLTGQARFTTSALVAGLLSSAALGLADDPQPQRAKAAGERPALRLDAPAGWTGERITLPPGFARDMKLQGIEEIRFAPGMFDAEAESFFSYVLVFQVGAKPPLSKDVLHRELLAYYRGLSAAVLKGRGMNVDTDGFKLTLKATEASRDAPRPPGMRSLHGELDWVEPFATRKRQTLHLVLEAWQDAAGGQGYLFIMASPQPQTAAIWAEMKKIRAGFHRARPPAG